MVPPPPPYHQNQKQQQLKETPEQHKLEKTPTKALWLLKKKPGRKSKTE